MTDLGESSRRGERAPRGVRRWCEDFASRAVTYPFPFRTPAHGWPARPKRTRYVVAAPLARGSRHVRLRRVLKWEKCQPIQGLFEVGERILWLAGRLISVIGLPGLRQPGR
jgi:hypothetical protein